MYLIQLLFYFSPNIQNMMNLYSARALSFGSVCASRLSSAPKTHVMFSSRSSILPIHGQSTCSLQSNYPRVHVEPDWDHLNHWVWFKWTNHCVCESILKPEIWGRWKKGTHRIFRSLFKRNRPKIFTARTCQETHNRTWLLMHEAK